MQNTPWILSKYKASLQTDKLSAAFRLDQQSAGLTLSFHGTTWSQATLAGIQLPDSDDLLAPSDSYLRGADAIADYELPENEIHVEIYRRNLQLAVGDAQCPGIETIVALWTDRLDTAPVVNATTTVSNAEVVSLEAACPLGSAWLIRPTDAAWSYVEMIPSTDFQSASQSVDGTSTVIRYPFFGQHLEKGVIRKARIRGLFVERSRDVERATAALQSLQSEAPPLKT